MKWNCFTCICLDSQNNTQGQRETFTYDAEHRLIEIHSEKDGCETRRDIDPLGRRIAKTEHDSNGYPLGETRFDWEGLRLLQEHRHSQTSLYIYEEDGYLRKGCGR
ncbi:MULTISPECIES: hypothetical protein [Pseudomonas]|jgi:YD repeat-containing protein|uniref:hypothetical protein n=1 Tax=Pseudomonas sp. PGPPP2 TaxID=2015554 RepID=UPI000BC4904C|nr:MULTISPECIES: hypothetical protein [Pseudomonas]MCT4498528.1 hypothetical protein [Pseudomonas sivasensis]OYT78006.1 MAG: hypothetical protein CFE48_17625 [Pseudomonas sp. PGPPP2]